MFEYEKAYRQGEILFFKVKKKQTIYSLWNATLNISRHKGMI